MSYIIHKKTDSVTELKDTRVVRTFFVSNYGDDDTGQGSILRPFKTLQKAVNVGASEGSAFEVFFDCSIGSQIVDLPSSAVVASFFGAFSPYPSSTIITFVLKNENSIYLNNVSAVLNGSNVTTSADVKMEESYISSITNSSKINLLLINTQLGMGVSPSNASGISRGLDSSWKFYDAIHFSNEVQMEDNKIKELGDATELSDAVNLGVARRNGFQPDVTLSGETPVVGDIPEGWVAGDKAFGIGTTGRIFLMRYDGTTIKYVELS